MFFIVKKIIFNIIIFINIKQLILSNYSLLNSCLERNTK